MAHRYDFRLFSLVLVAARPAVADGPASDVLDVTARSPVVTVARGAPGRRHLSLPSLQYAFEIGARCGGGKTPESLSISIADTRLALSAAELDAGRPITLTIPADQIAPIAVNGYCELQGVEPEAAGSGLEFEIAPMASHPGQITVRAALSAQVSLLCSNTDERHMTYLAQPLDVLLACEAPAGDDLEPAGNASPLPVPRARPEVEVEERE